MEIGKQLSEKANQINQELSYDRLNSIKRELVSSANYGRYKYVYSGDLTLPEKAELERQKLTVTSVTYDNGGGHHYWLITWDSNDEVKAMYKDSITNREAEAK